MSRSFALCLTLGMAIGSLPGLCVPVSAQTPALTIHISHTINDSVGPQPIIGVEVLVEHPFDSIAGLELWLKLDSTLPVRFKMTSDSIPVYSLAGSPLGEFELLTIRSIRGDGTDVRIFGLAENNFAPPFRRGFAPGTFPHRLIHLQLVVLGGADTLPQPLGQIEIDTSLQEFGFATPVGESIGVTDGHLDWNLIDFVIDSIAVNLGSCTAQGDVDNDGIPLTFADLVVLRDAIQGRAALPGYAFMADFNGDCTVDSADVTLLERYFQQGMTALAPYPRPTCCYQSIAVCCEGGLGNVDCDPTHNVDVSDLTAMIGNLFINIGDPCCWTEADLDGNGGIDVSDLTTLIDALFISLSPLPNCPLGGTVPLRAVSSGQ